MRGGLAGDGQETAHFFLVNSQVRAMKRVRAFAVAKRPLETWPLDDGTKQISAGAEDEGETRNGD